MRRFFCLLIVLSLPFFSFSQEWKPFTDTAGKFTATYPSNWVNKIKTGNRVFFTSPADKESDMFYENINISVTQKAGYSDLKVTELFPTIPNSLKKELIEFKEEGQRFFKWNNIDAAEIIYSGYSKLDETMKVRTVQWYCFYASRLYVVTFVASADNSSHNETASKIMNSIQFK